MFSPRAEEDRSVLYNETQGGNGSHASPLSSPAGDSREGLVGSSGPDASRTDKEGGKKEHDEQDDKHEEDEKGEGSGRRLNAGTSVKAVQALNQEADHGFDVDNLPETFLYPNRDTLHQRSVLYNETQGGNGSRASPISSPAGDSWEGLVGSSGPDASCTGKEGGEKGHDEQDEKHEEEEKGEGSGRRLYVGARVKSVQALNQGADPILNVDNSPEALSIIKWQRDRLRDLTEENRDLGEHEQEVSFENDLLRRQRNEVCAENDLLRRQRNELCAENDLIRRQKNEVIAENDLFRRQWNEVSAENDLLRRQLKDINRKYDALACRHASRVAGSVAATAQAEQASSFEKMDAKLHASIYKAREGVENARRNQAEKSTLRSCEHDANVSSALITSEASPTLSAALPSSVTVEDEDSPAARASARLARDGTPATASMTPPGTAPAASSAGAPKGPRGAVDKKKREGGRGSSNAKEPAIASAPGVGRSTLPVYLQPARRQGMVGFSEDQRSPPGPVNRPPPRRKGTNASSGHQGPSPASVNRPPARKNGAVASSGAVGLSAGPDDRPPSRKQGIPDPSGTFGQSANPVDRPTVRQGKVPKKSTTSRRPLHCTRGTISSQSRSRTAIKSTASRGMVF